MDLPLSPDEAPWTDEYCSSIPEQQRIQRLLYIQHLAELEQEERSLL